jgi:6-pyruvoyl-tetrahydropterin synthase
MTTTAELSTDQLAACVARGDKRCQFGHAHRWFFEVDFTAGKNSGWVVCDRCDARQWDGE